MTIRASRTRFVWTPVLGWVLLSCAATAVHAQVETPSPARQTLDQQTPQVDLPDASSSEPAALPRGGTSLASASARSRCFRQLDLNLGYDDNVFATTTATTASAVAVVRPSLELRSEWLNHSLRLLASRRVRLLCQRADPELPELPHPGRRAARHPQRCLRDRPDRLSAHHRSARHARTCRSPRRRRWSIPCPIELALYQRFNRLFYQLSVSATKYWYYDYSTITLARPAGGKPRPHRVRRKDHASATRSPTTSRSSLRRASTSASMSTR